MDFILTNHGNVSLLYAITERAKHWLKDRKKGRQWLSTNKGNVEKLANGTIQINRSVSLEIVGSLEDGGLTVKY
jgi:hypothetical protein